MWCQWWPGLDPVPYGFRYELTVVQRKPVRKLISSHLLYCSETEILRAIELLGRDGYDFIWKSPSGVGMELGVEPEDRAGFRAAWDRLGAGCGARKSANRDGKSWEMTGSLQPVSV